MAVPASTPKSANDGGRRVDRAAIIRTVQTPLGFFTLVVLIVEAIFGVIVPTLTGDLKGHLVYSMVVLIFVLVAIVAAMGVYKPEALNLTPSQFQNHSRALRSGDEAIVKRPIENEVVTSFGLFKLNTRMEPYTNPA
jgi:hypothetical protein